MSRASGITVGLVLIAAFKLLQQRRQAATATSTPSPAADSTALASSSSSSSASSSPPATAAASSLLSPRAQAISSEITSSLQSRPLIICGPSGVGKGTLVTMLLNEFPSLIGKSISHTTRPPRKGETDGISYHFTEKSKMEREFAQGKFIEKAVVHGNLYGTSVDAVKQVIQSGKICILEIDIEGVKNVKRANLNPFCIFINTPDMNTLRTRLVGRNTDTEEGITIRMATAVKELRDLHENRELFDHVLVNGDKEEAYNELKAILCKQYPQLLRSKM